MPIEFKPIESKPSASRQIESVPMDTCSLNPELMLWVAGGNYNSLRGNRNRGVENDLTLPYLKLSIQFLCTPKMNITFP